jgi:poly(A) polymerase
VSRTIDPPWLRAPATRAVIAALEAAGGPDCARFVGGCVRDALLDKTTNDIDIATTLEPQAVVAALKAASLKAVPTGIAHGTVTAVSQRRPHEVTTLRRDVSTDGRRATVAFTTDWAEDAARRDFRLNALYAQADGRIHDPTGHGLDDALAGRIVFVGEPERRIREDYLRILRFFRFQAWYGRLEPDADGLAACSALSQGMAQLSAERVSTELLKLLAAPDPVPAMRAMAQAGVLARILPEAEALDMFEAMARRSADPALRLSALLPADPALVAAVSTRLRLPNALRDRLAAAGGQPLDAAMTDREGRAALYRLGRQAFSDRLMRAAAHDPETDPARLLALADTWTPPRLPVGGRDLAALGLEPGPETGRILSAFEAGWIADDFPETGHRERLAALVSGQRG